MFIILCANDTVIISNNSWDFQVGLDIVENYCNKWEIAVNIEKKVVIFCKGGK